MMMAQTSESSKLMEMMTANTGKTELMPLQMMAKGI
jgi:hypothetical protein